MFRGDLNPAYGCCAVALTATQPNLPADWPGGNRIAIHGTDAPLGEAASHGCIRSADEDVSRLVDTVPPGDAGPDQPSYSMITSSQSEGTLSFELANTMSKPGPQLTLSLVLLSPKPVASSWSSPGPPRRTSSPFSP